MNQTGEQSISSLADLQVLRPQLIQGMLRAVAIVGLIAVVAGSVESYLDGRIWPIPFYVGTYAVVVFLLIWRGAPYNLQVGSLIALVYAQGFIGFIQEGQGGSARVFMLIIPFLAGILWGQRESILTLLLCTLTMGGFGIVFSMGLITVPSDPTATDLSSWLAGTSVLFMAGLLMVVSLNYLISRLATSLEQGRQFAQGLEEQSGWLEEQVATRTADLERRGLQLETAARVGRDVAAIQDVDRLLEQTARLVSDRFGFYHTGIFLLDEAKEYAVLRAVSPGGGQFMLAQGHRLRVDEASIVGYVTGQGEPRIALDVGEDAVHFDNPYLPETRSEMALPLRARGEVIGALDVQSVEPEAFSQEDTAALQILADQVAMAISNAQLFQQAQESLEAERRAYGELSREAWQELFRARPDLPLRYDPQGILSADGRRREGEPLLGDHAAPQTLAIPLKVREQVVGVLDAHKPTEASDWTAEEIELLETLVDRWIMALDSARLYQDTMRRAARDRLVSEVTAHMRETLDVETVLKTAVDEIARALGLAALDLQLGLGDEAHSQARSGMEKGKDGP